MAAHGKFAILPTVAASYRFVFSRPLTLLRIGWLPLFLLFLVDVGIGANNPGIEALTGAMGKTPAVKLGVTVLAQTLIAVVLLVAWHRVVLLDPQNAGGLAAPRVGRREINYFGFWALLSTVFAVVLALASTVIVAAGFSALQLVKLGYLLAEATDVPRFGGNTQFKILVVFGVLCGVFAAIYVSIRLSLVLPAIATDRGRPLIESWRLSRSNGWRLTAASVMVLLPPELVSLTAAAVMAGADGTALHMPMAVIHATAMVVLIVSTGTILSLFSLALDGAVQPVVARPAGALPTA